MREHRSATRGDVPFTVGSFSGPLYVGEPDWDVGQAISGPPDHIVELLQRIGSVGVDQVQVAFRSRSVDELCDQIEATGRDVVPHLDVA